MKTITNKTLWSKAGFVEFADRDAAVAFYKACCSRNLAVAAGVYQSEATDWAFYYIAKAGGNALDRIDDYASYIEATCNDEESGFPVTPTNALLTVGVTKVAPFFSTRIDPIHHCPLN